MNIEFYNKHTGEVLQNTDDTYFVMNDAVFKVSDDTFESQAAVIDFNTFIEWCPTLAWRIGNKL